MLFFRKTKTAFGLEINSVTAKFPQSSFCWEYRRMKDWRPAPGFCLQGWKSVLRKPRQIPEVEASPRRAAHLQLGKQGINRSMLRTRCWRSRNPLKRSYISPTLVNGQEWGVLFLGNSCLGVSRRLPKAHNHSDRSL